MGMFYIENSDHNVTTSMMMNLAQGYKSLHVLYGTKENKEESQSGRQKKYMSILSARWM